MADGTNRIKDIREKRNMTQQELAEKIGSNVRSIRRWENGESSPDVYEAIQICCALGVKIQDIFQI